MKKNTMSEAMKFRALLVAAIRRSEETGERKHIDAAHSAIKAASVKMAVTLFTFSDGSTLDISTYVTTPARKKVAKKAM